MTAVVFMTTRKASNTMMAPEVFSTKPRSGLSDQRNTCTGNTVDASVMPYIGRSGWNTLRVAGKIPDDEVREAVDASYDAVVAKLPKRERPT